MRLDYGFAQQSMATKTRMSTILVERSGSPSKLALVGKESPAYSCGINYRGRLKDKQIDSISSNTGNRRIYQPVEIIRYALVASERV